eukprot:TRINITY_DN26782_c0_g2_i1.p1 TRINITY_DN26782_c0_g2~~TRINITY_DN26782_c0_g2_i1.p1  ORF type:complete len:580 (-),score=124.13 TRINITY_DN26782_c0_g2_i1:75-1730(-)
MRERSRSPTSLRRETESSVDDLLSELEKKRRFRLQPGSKVRLFDLKGAVELNGKIGILERFLRDSGRWRVKLPGGVFKDLKPDNLTETLEAPPAAAPAPVSAPAAPTPSALRPGCAVTLHGLKAAPELNGQRGVLTQLVEETGRWRVKLSSGVSKDLKPDNLLADGADVAPASHAAPTAASATTSSQAAEKAPCTGADGGFRGQIGAAIGPGGRFVIQEMLGEGVFSTVYRCRDAEVEGQEYAVKFTRASREMRSALEREIELMGYLCSAEGTQDPEGVARLVRLAFYEGFEHEGHLAVAFELMRYNLSDALAKYGRNRGLPLLPTVRNFGRDIFLALRALRQAGLIHCDVKPENLLLCRESESCKLADFGATRLLSERSPTDNLQPRFYRSPEILLGQDYCTQIDVWSAGATLFQLATDCIIFQGENNNEMLREIMKVVGGFPKAFATRGACAAKHFNADGDFLNKGGDVGLGSTNPWRMPMEMFEPAPRPLSGLLNRLRAEPPKGVALSRHEGLVSHLTHLLSQLLTPDPAERPTPEVALEHRFFQRGA